MGYTVGMPVIKLDRQNHFGKSNAHSGNARAVVCEALEERRSGDVDLDRSKTALNVYYGETSGETLCNAWEQMADEYRVIDKNGHEKKLRGDAGIGFAGICKPEADLIDTLEPEEVSQFMQDSIEVIKHIYESRGCIIDAAVIHYDEGNPHIHYFGHDPNYQLGKKLNLNLYRALNASEYPKSMRERGWDIQDLTGYLEAVEGLSDAERDEYKAKRKAERKKHGKCSAVYKAEKQAEEIIVQAKIQAKTIQVDASANASVMKIELDRREKELNARETRLNALESDLTEKMKNYTLDVKKGVETALERRDAERQKLDEFEKQKQSEMKQAHRRYPDIPEW